MDNKESNITSRRSATVAAKAARITPATAVPVTASTAAAPAIATATPVSASPVCVCVSPPSFVSVHYS